MRCLDAGRGGRVSEDSGLQINQVVALEEVPGSACNLIFICRSAMYFCFCCEIEKNARNVDLIPLKASCYVMIPTTTKDEVFFLPCSFFAVTQMESFMSNIAL